MPIRINLLAEAQALEDLRRRDPVKRTVLIGIVLVALMLGWSVLLLGQTMVCKSELASIESDLNSRTNEYRQIIQNKANLDESKLKLVELNRLATNRFLVGDLLNTLQKGTMDNVQLVRLKVTQNYLLIDESKAREEGERPAPAKIAKITEKIVLTLNAKDNSPAPGDSINKYREGLSSAPYFQNVLGRMNEFRLNSPSPPQSDADGKQFVLFTVEAYFPDKTR